MHQHQLSIFDIEDKTSLKDKISKIIDCTEDRILNAIAKSIANFQSLPKNQKYILGCSGGKDSHVLLGIYHLYLKLNNPPLNLIIRFADTHLENKTLYKTIYTLKNYCSQQKNLTFEIVKGKESYWFTQFALGYPVPNYRARWCTGKLKVKPMQPSRKLATITGRHYGESKSRDDKLKQKSCNTDTCGTDKLKKNSYDPIAHWSNCLVWDALYYFDDTVLYENCFSLLQQQYSIAEDTKTGSLRLGCFMCPVISLKTIAKNEKCGLIDKKAVSIRLLLEELRGAIRINNPRTKKSGAIYIEERRKYWEKLDTNYLLENDYIDLEDIQLINKSLKSDYSYPPTYTKEWIEEQHALIKTVL